MSIQKIWIRLIAALVLTGALASTAGAYFIGLYGAERANFEWFTSSYGNGVRTFHDTLLEHHAHESTILASHPLVVEAARTGDLSQALDAAWSSRTADQLWLTVGRNGEVTSSLPACASASVASALRERSRAFLSCGGTPVMVATGTQQVDGTDGLHLYLGSVLGPDYVSMIKRVTATEVTLMRDGAVLATTYRDTREVEVAPRFEPSVPEGIAGHDMFFGPAAVEVASYGGYLQQSEAIAVGQDTVDSFVLAHTVDTVDGTLPIALVLSVPRVLMEKGAMYSTLGVFAISLVVVVLLVVVAYALVVRFTRPLTLFARAAARLGAGEEEVLIGSIGGGAELETVAAAFDDMAVRVAELRRNDRESVELQRVRADQLARAHEELTATHISLQNAQRQLVDTSRRAGMAEVATNVLHNVGNVLNTVNVSADVLRRGLHDSKQTSLERAVRLFPTEPEELRRFLSDDPKSDKVAALLTALAAELRAERDAMTAEVSTLVNNIDHLKRVVSNQQQMATHRGGVEVVAPAEVLDAALLLQSVAETDVAVQIVRDYAPVDPILIDRHRVLQVVLNLLSNARHALRDGQLAEPRLVLRLAEDNDQLVIEVEDNGVGIDPDHIDALFQHGFTTKTDGHGFGLHDGANAAAEMGGSLEAHSAGPGHGARFALRLPLARPQAKVAAEHSGVRPRPSDAPHPSTGVI